MHNVRYRFCISFVVLYIIFCLVFQSCTYAVYNGDDQYTDRNSTIKIAYDSCVADFLLRLENVSSNYKSALLSKLKSGEYSFYCFYGSSDGSDMINQTIYNTRNLYCLIYLNNNPQLSTSQYTNYQGMDCDIYNMIVPSGSEVFAFAGNNMQVLSPVSTYILPSILINYYPNIMIEYLNNSSVQQTESINQTITSTAQQTQNVIEQSAQQTQQTMTNSTVDDNTMTVDTSFATVTDSEGVFSFLLDLTQSVYNYFSSIDSSVTVINIPVPFVENQYISLRSDIISSHIAGTSLVTLIDLCWWFVFGVYYVMFIKRIIDWFASGKFVSEGAFSFMEWLDIHNEIIKSYMM